MENQRQKLEQYRQTMGQLYQQSSHALVDEQTKAKVD